MITIVYAYRNRELTRIKASLDSLQIQNVKNFKVVFVDYGSEKELALSIKNLVESYSFANYFYIHASTLLWNKSKALNYGINKVSTEYVFIADVDLIFSPDTITYFEKIIHPDKINLFKLGYLDKQNSLQLTKPYKFEELNPKHYGTINGMVLTSKKALEKVQGYDTFFHFYGAEDVDLYSRLANAGYEIIINKEIYFYHNWHIIYNTYNDKKMSVTPRLYNIKRINEQHYFFNQKNKVLVPYNQENFGNVVKKEDQEKLFQPTKFFKLSNIYSVVHHFIYVQLPTFENEIVKVSFQEDSNNDSLKYYLKKFLKKQTQPYISIKQINDLLLSEILYRYKHHNYAYEISKDLKRITFTVKL